MTKSPIDNELQTEQSEKGSLATGMESGATVPVVIDNATGEIIQQPTDLETVYRSVSRTCIKVVDQCDKALNKRNATADELFQYTTIMEKAIRNIESVDYKLRQIDRERQAKKASEKYITVQPTTMQQLTDIFVGIQALESGCKYN